MKKTLFSALLLASLAALAPRSARAQASPAEEIALLEAVIAKEVIALAAQVPSRGAPMSAGGCVIACRALGSMERAAARLCQLDPGPRCDDARAKVKEASRRVMEACAECRATREEAPPPVRANGKPGDKPAVESPSPAVESPAPPPPPPMSPPRDAADHGGAPAAEVRRGGGCAGCHVGERDSVSGGWLAALLGALLLMRRRRR